MSSLELYYQKFIATPGNLYHGLPGLTEDIQRSMLQTPDGQIVAVYGHEQCALMRGVHGLGDHQVADAHIELYHQLDLDGKVFYVQTVKANSALSGLTPIPTNIGGKKVGLHSSCSEPLKFYDEEPITNGLGVGMRKKVSAFGLFAILSEDFKLGDLLRLQTPDQMLSSLSNLEENDPYVSKVYNQSSIMERDVAVKPADSNNGFFRLSAGRILSVTEENNKDDGLLYLKSAIEVVVGKAQHAGQDKLPIIIVQDSTTSQSRIEAFKNLLNDMRLI